MEFDFFDYEGIISIIISLFNVFLNSGFFLFVKFILAIYVSVLFVDIVLLLIVRELGGDIRDTLKGAQMPLASKKKLKQRWDNIENRLKANNDQQNKIAILEADKLVDEILFNIGFKDGNMKEKLENITPLQLEERDSLIEAHEIRNKIIQDDKFYLDKDETIRVMNIYREFLDNQEII